MQNCFRYVFSSIDTNIEFCDTFDGCVKRAAITGLVLDFLLDNVLMCEDCSGRGMS